MLHLKETDVNLRLRDLLAKVRRSRIVHLTIRPLHHLPQLPLVALLPRRNGIDTPDAYHPRSPPSTGGRVCRRTSDLGLASSCPLALHLFPLRLLIALHSLDASRACARHQTDV